MCFQNKCLYSDDYERKTWGLGDSSMSKEPAAVRVSMRVESGHQAPM